MSVLIGSPSRTGPWRTGLLRRKGDPVVRAAGLLAAGVVSVVLASGCAMLSNPLVTAQVHVSKSKPFIITQSDAALGWEKFAFSWMNRYGDAIYLWYQVSSGNKEQGPAFSHDGGRSWQVGASKADAQFHRVNPAFIGAVDVEEGTLCYATGTWAADAPVASALIDKRSGEVTKWDAPWSSGTNNISSFVAMTRGFEVRPGLILVPGHTLPGAVGPSGRCRVVLMASKDGGRSWEFHSTVATDEDTPWGNSWPHGFEGPSECEITVTLKGDLLCVSRMGVKQKNSFEDATEAMNMVLSRSRDGGLTWSHTRLPFAGVCPKLLRLSNDVLVLAFGRPGINVAFSADDGRTWGKEVALLPANARTSGYIDIVEVAPDRVLAVYDAYNTDLGGLWLWEPKEVNGVLGCFLSVKKLW